MPRISETRESLSSTFAPIGEPFSGLKSDLEAGRSSAVLVLGDSTGNAADEWVYLLAQSLGADYPGHTIRHRLWNIGTEKWDAPSVVQTGTAESGAARSVEFDGATAAYRGTPDSSLVSITGDLDARIHVAADPWTTGTLISQFGNAPNRAWRMYLGGGPTLNFDWSEDGSALETVVSASLSGLVTDGEPLWLRVTLDVDNGSAGHDVAFYHSADGVAWTQIGSTVTRAGATSIADVAQSINVGARADGVAERLAGKVYEVHLLDGIDGHLVMPALPELLTAAPSTYNGVTAGAPILDIWNGSGSGYGMGNLTDATRMPKMSPPLNQSVTLFSCSHNDGGRTDPSLWADWDTLIAHVLTRSPMSGLVLCAQNPRYSPATYIVEHATRARSMRRLAAKNQGAFADVYTAFGADETLVSGDGVHPSATGSALWAATVRAVFDAAP